MATKFWKGLLFTWRYFLENLKVNKCIVRLWPVWLISLVTGSSVSGFCGCVGQYTEGYTMKLKGGSATDLLGVVIAGGPMLLLLVVRGTT